MVGDRVVDERPPRPGQLHDAVAAVGRIRTAHDEPPVLQPLQAVRHRGRGEDQRPREVAGGGTYTGRDAALAFVGHAAEVTGGTLQLTVHRVLDDGEWGVALATYTATRPDRDRPLENNLAHVARLRDGLIAESWLHSRDQYAVDEFWGEPVPATAQEVAS